MSDVCSSELKEGGGAITDIEGREGEATGAAFGGERDEALEERLLATAGAKSFESRFDNSPPACGRGRGRGFHVHGFGLDRPSPRSPPRSEEHTSELQSLMRISYAVFCLKKTKNRE